MELLLKTPCSMLWSYCMASAGNLSLSCFEYSLIQTIGSNTKAHLWIGRYKSMKRKVKVSEKHVSEMVEPSEPVHYLSGYEITVNYNVCLLKRSHNFSPLFFKSVEFSMI